MARTLIIAECGNCHEGNPTTALWMLHAAHGAGADIVKFQAGTAEGFARAPEDIPRYRRYELGVHGYGDLYREARRVGVPVMFSVWSRDPAFDVFRQLPHFKIAARQSSPAFVSQHDRPGVFYSIPATVDLNDYATIRSAVPMHVVPEYPAADGGLERLRELAAHFQQGYGYSDHCLGTDVCLEAVRRYGARVIEKHFTLAHNAGPLRDHVHGATPDEFRAMVEAIRRHER